MRNAGLEEAQAGSTIAANPTKEALPGYRPARPMVYCGIYTEDGSKYPDCMQVRKQQLELDVEQQTGSK